MPIPVLPKKIIRITTVPMALRYLLAGQMKFMTEHGFDVIMISAGGKELPDVLHNENCRHIVVGMTRKITPFRDLKCLVQLIRIFRRERPAIVHTHTPKAGLLGMLAAWFSGVPVRIHTVAGLPMMVKKGFKHQLLKWTEKITAGAATQVWPNSFSLLRYIQQHGLARQQKLRVIGKGSTNGIDTGFFNPASIDEKVSLLIKAGIQYSAAYRYLLFIGRLVTDKGVAELVSAFCVLQQQRTGLKLILIGDFEEDLDPLPASVRTTIATHPAIFHINWTTDVKYYMHLANYFIFPSHREGFPNVLLQAGAMGLPIICSEIAGNIDIVTDKETGLLFECLNERQIIELTEWAMDNPELMKKMAGRLQQIIQNDFRRENIWQNILEAYKSLLN